MFTLTFFEILHFKGRSVLGPAEQVPRSERVTFSVKNQNNCGFCWNCLKSNRLTKLEGFERFLNFFDFVLPF